MSKPKILTILDEAATLSNIKTATLSASSWSGDSAPYTYTLAVNGVTATSNQELLPALNITEEQLTALQAANIQDGGQAANSITLTAFGDKFGLSENDLVVFGNTALAKGINIAQVSDLESVFRAIYPEQYAIRVQRMQHTPTSQIFGGSTMFINPTAMSEQAADNYVEGFLKGAMPNQYRKK